LQVLKPKGCTAADNPVHRRAVFESHPLLQLPEQAKDFRWASRPYWSILSPTPSIGKLK
jgi:hypothetical protein